MHLTIDERVEIIMLCGHEGLSYRQVADIFNERHVRMPPLSFTAVGSLLKKFKETGSVHDKKHEQPVPKVILAYMYANQKDSLTK